MSRKAKIGKDGLLEWKHTRAKKWPPLVATSTCGPYEILHHKRYHVLIFEPGGTESDLGEFPSTRAAKLAAKEHASSSAASAKRCQASVHVLGVCGKALPCPDHTCVRCDGWPKTPCKRRGIVVEVTDCYQSDAKIPWVYKEWKKRRHRRLCAKCAYHHRFAIYSCDASARKNLTAFGAWPAKKKKAKKR